MRMGCWLGVLSVMGCVATADGPPMGNGQYLLSATEMRHYSEEGLAAALRENKAIFGGGEGCTQRVGEGFVRQIEAFAKKGKPIASVKGLEWSHWGELAGEPKTVGYIAIILGGGKGRVALTDVSVLEIRDGQLFLLPEAIFNQAAKLIYARLNGPNCPFEN